MKRITIQSLQKLCYPCFWITGLLAGAFFAVHAHKGSEQWMLALINTQMSLPSLLLSLTLPFVISAIFFRLSLPLLIAPIIFLKAFTFSLCANLIVLCYSDAGWLMRFLFLFSDSFVVIILLWFCFNGNRKQRVNLRQDLFLCIVFTLLIGFIDFNVIAPFGASLLA